MEIPGYEPFYLHSLDELRAEIARLGLDIPVAGSTDALFLPRQIAGRTLPNAFCAQPIASRNHQKLAEGGFSLLWFAEPTTPLPPSEHRIQIAQIAPACVGECDDAAVESHLAALVESAKSAIAAGFDGVDISCHRGTLAEKLLAARKRPGRFGGSLENRMRFLLEALCRIREANPTAILAVRLNAFHACEGGFGVDPEDFRKPDTTEPVLLARALLSNPQILILDEPTQGLDQPGEAAFYRLIEEVRRDTGVAVLMVSHDLHVVMAASDRVICLNGHICCEGTPRVVSTAPEYRALFGLGTQGALALYQHVHDHSHDGHAHDHAHDHGHHGHDHTHHDHKHDHDHHHA